MFFRFLSLSGLCQSWPVTHTPWWQSHCTTRSAQRPSPTLLTKVHKRAPLRVNHAPPAVLSQCFTARTLIQTKRLTWLRLFFSCRLNSDLRCTRKGSDDSGLCRWEGGNSEDDCAHGGAWQRPADPRTAVWHRDPEFEGRWGENKHLIFRSLFMLRTSKQPYLFYAVLQLVSTEHICNHH